MDEYKKYKLMLDEALKIQLSKSFEKTFLDVAGYPHYENVISNILAFLFADDEEHGFKDLWVRSLLECYNCVSKDKIEVDNIIVNSVDREVVTKGNKRIDILIETDNYLIVIENKINANVYNPLGNYNEYAERYVKEDSSNLKMVEILLSKNKQPNINDFYNITYNMLLDRVKYNAGEYISNCQEKWLIYLKDFMRCIERFNGENSMIVNKDWNKFLEENNEIVTEFLDKYLDDLGDKIELLKQLTIKLKSLDTGNHEIGMYNTTKKIGSAAYASCWINIKKYDDCILAVEPYIMKKPSKEKYEQGNVLYIAIWNRDHNNKKCNFDYLLTEIKEKSDVEPEKITTDGWGEHYILKRINLAEDFDLDKVALDIMSIVDLIY